MMSGEVLPAPFQEKVAEVKLSQKNTGSGCCSQLELENKKREQMTAVPSFKKVKALWQNALQGKRNVTREREPHITGQSRRPSRKRIKALTAAHNRI